MQETEAQPGGIEVIRFSVDPTVLCKCSVVLKCSHLKIGSEELVVGDVILSRK